VKLHVVHLAPNGRHPVSFETRGDAKDGTIIAVELTEQDKVNIAKMPPGFTIYAVAEDSVPVELLDEVTDELKERGS